MIKRLFVVTSVLLFHAAGAMNRSPSQIHDLLDTTFEDEVKELVFGCEHGKDDIDRGLIRPRPRRVYYFPFFIKVLKYAKIHPALINNQTESYTPLIRAAQQHDIKRCKILLEHGADINKATYKFTPILAAVEDYYMYNDTLRADAMVRFLMARGADINKPSGRGQTPIMLSAERKDEGALTRILLYFGADPLICDKEGNNALYYSLMNPDSEFASCEAMLEFLMVQQSVQFKTFLCCLQRMKQSDSQYEKYIASALYSNRKKIWDAYVLSPVSLFKEVLTRKNKLGCNLYEYLMSRNYNEERDYYQRTKLFLNPANADRTQQILLTLEQIRNEDT